MTRAQLFDNVIRYPGNTSLSMLTWFNSTRYLHPQHLHPSIPQMPASHFHPPSLGILVRDELVGTTLGSPAIHATGLMTPFLR
jgi:hypothetical protein